MCIYIMMHKLITGEDQVDELICQKVIKGEVQLFNQLIDKYYAELFRFVLRQTNDIEITKNLLQEIFMRIYNNLKKYRPEKASFRTWIYKVASNHTLNYFRKEKQYLPTIPFEFAMASKEDILMDTCKREQIEYTLELMKKTLNAKNFQILLLHFFSHFSNQEIASTFGIAEKTVRNIISESIKKVRNKVGDDNVYKEN